MIIQLLKQKETIGKCHHSITINTLSQVSQTESSISPKVSCHTILTHLIAMTTNHYSHAQQRVHRNRYIWGIVFSSVIWNWSSSLVLMLVGCYSARKCGSHAGSLPSYFSKMLPSPLLSSECSKSLLLLYVWCQRSESGVWCCDFILENLMAS